MKSVKRDLQLDSLRGIFLLVMAIDHFEGPLRKMFYEKLGFFTAAEGFVFLSGFVAGMVYGKIGTKRDLFKKSFARTLVIYRYQLITVILLFFLVLFIPVYKEFWGSHVSEYLTSTLNGIISSVLLMYEPNPIDILPMYIFFILLMPFMILLLKSNRILMFFLVTLALYFAGQFLRQNSFHLGGIIIDFGFFNYLSWQILFFTGIFLGYMKWERQEFIIPYNQPLLLGAFIICVLFFLWRGLFLFNIQSSFTNIGLDEYRILFNKQSLGILRIINFLSFCYLIAVFLNRHRNFLTNYKPLIFLGQHSIQAFTYHIVIYILFFPLYRLISKMNPVIEILYSLAMLLLMYFALVMNNRIKKSWVKAGHF